MIATTREEAAEARRAGVRAQTDRPSQRRSAELPGSAARVAAKAKLELRSAGTSGSLDFLGLASATDSPYDMWDQFGPYVEQVTSGAFGKTLAQPDLDVPLVLSHDSMRRIARTTNGSLTLSETSDGLLSDAPNLDPKDADVAYVTPKIQSGLIDEMSFRFAITAGEWSPNFDEYHITEVDLHRGDVSIVGYGANPATSAQLRTIVDKVGRGAQLDQREASIIASELGVAPAAGSIQLPPGKSTLRESLRDMTNTDVRALDRKLRHELERRQMSPTMTFADVLDIGE